MGNVFFDDPLVLKEVSQRGDRRATRPARRRRTPTSPRSRTTCRALDDAYGKEISGLGVVRVRLQLLHRRLGADQGRSRRSTATSATRASSRRLLNDASTLDAPWGEVKLDENRNGDRGQLRQGDRRRHERRRRPGREDDPAHPGRRADVRRHVHRGHAGARPHEPEVREGQRRRPGSATPRRSTSRRSSDSGSTSDICRARRADPPLAGGRPALRRRPRRPRRGPRGQARRTPGHPRPQRRRQDDAVQPDLGRVPADHRVGRAVRRRRRRARLRASVRAWASRARSRRRGCSSACRSRTTCTWRCSASTQGHFRLVKNKHDAEMREKARVDGRRRRPRRTCSTCSSPSSRTASSASSRSGMARAERPEADDARRAGRRAVARRARAADRDAARSSTRRSR